jgi:uncharacterized membrane protein YoaK (UPF0700 family)
MRAGYVAFGGGFTGFVCGAIAVHALPLVKRRQVAIRQWAAMPAFGFDEGDEPQP